MQIPPSLSATLLSATLLSGIASAMVQSEPAAAAQAPPNTAQLAKQVAQRVAPAGDDPIARAGDQLMSRNDYAHWLLQQYGVTHLKDYVTSRLILRAAQEDGLAPSDETVAAAYQAEHDRIVQDFHRGDVERYYMSLRARGLEPASYAISRGESLRVQLSQEALALEHRQISEEKVRTRYRDTYNAEPGQPGEHVAIEVMFFDMYATLVRDGTPPDQNALREEARERARLARAELLAGAELSSLANLGNPVPSEFAPQGRVEPYRKMLLGPELERAVSSLDLPGQVSATVDIYNGFYLVRLVKRQAVTFAEVRDVLRAELESMDADTTDLSNVSNWVFERYNAELLLR